MTDVWDDVAESTNKVPRDRYGRPILVPAAGGKAKPYTRFSTLAETLDDRFNLERWKERQVAIGLQLRPDLLNLVAAHRGDKDKLNEVCVKAKDAAGAEAAANDGTALHALIEQDLAGDDLSHLSPQLAADVAAMRDCLARHAFTVVHVERFLVCEALGAAGTPDLLVERAGELYVGDWKSGAGQVEWGLGRIAIQLAGYAHAETFYAPGVGHERVPHINQSRAYVFHIPMGTAHCELVEVDIVAGWEAARTARWVRDYRARKDLGRSVTAAADTLDIEREWLATRVRALPDAAVVALARMAGDAGLPRVSRSAHEHCADWATLLDLIEAEYAVPFGERNPTTKRKGKR